MKEHKKLYKAGKRWLTATILTASSALLLAGATTVSAHAAGPGDSSTTPAIPATQPASQPSGTQSGTNNGAPVENGPAALPVIHDGNVTISGPDQNASQRASLTQQMQNLNSQIRPRQTQVISDRVAYAKVLKEYNAASDNFEKFDSLTTKANNTWTPLHDDLQTRYNSVIRQKDNLNQRALRDENLWYQYRMASDNLMSQYYDGIKNKTLSETQLQDLENQAKKDDQQGDQYGNSYNMLSERVSNFNDIAEKYSDALTALSTDYTNDYLKGDFTDFKDYVKNTNNLSAFEKSQIQNSGLLEDMDQLVECVNKAKQAGYTSTYNVPYAWVSSVSKQKDSLKAKIDKEVPQLTKLEHDYTQLQLQLNANPIVRSATKTVTRTINLNVPGQSPVTQTATITGTATMNDDDSAATSYNWTTNGNWAAYTVPDVNGYTHTQNTVAAKSVDGTTADTTVTVNYTETDAHRYGSEVELGPITVTVNPAAVPQPKLLNKVASSSITNPLFVSLYRDPSTLVTLPAGTTAAWANPAEVANDVKHVHDYTPDVVVTFPDGSTTTLQEQLHVVGSSNPGNPANPSNPRHDHGGTTTPSNPSNNPGGPTNPSTPGQPTNHHGSEPSNPSNNPGGPTNPSTPGQPSNNHGNEPTNPSNTHGTTPANNPSNPGHSTTPSDQHQSQPSNPGNNNGEQPGQPSNTQPGNTTPTTPSQTTPGANTNPTPANNSGQGTPTTTVNANGNHGRAATLTFTTQSSANVAAQQLTAAQQASLSAARQALAAKQAAQESAYKGAKRTLPQTGNQNGRAAVLLGAFGGLLGFGLAADRKWLK